MSLVSLLVVVILVAAAVAIVVIAVKAMGVQIPAWAQAIFWVVVIALVAIFAIKLLLGSAVL